MLAVGAARVAHAQVQPQAFVGISDSAHTNPNTAVGGPQPVSADVSETLGGCTGSGDATAGVGLPSASFLIDSVSATDACDAQAAQSGIDEVVSTADGIRLYKVKGPGAIPPFGATVSEHLHGIMTTTVNLPVFAGGPADKATLASSVALFGGASGQLAFSDSAGDGIGGGPPVSPFFDNQGTASAAIYSIDHTFTQDATSFGGAPAYVLGIRFHLSCDASYRSPLGALREAGSPSCDFDLGDSSASLAATDASVVFEPVAPVRRTLPRSVAYLSPAIGPIETFAGTPGIPSTASGSGDLGQGAAGDGSATADLPPLPALVDTTGAASHVDQSAITADANATVSSEGQGAASLVYRATFLNGAQRSDYPSGIPVTLQVPTANSMLSATKGLDPGIVEHASFEITADVQGFPVFHFVTLSVGSSNEDPPGLSGDLSSACQDASTATTQACVLAGALVDEPLAIFPNAADNIVLTLQTDCATSLTHPSGPLPAAHVACDASHTVTADLISRDANIALTPVPEAGLGASLLAVGLSIRLLAWRAHRKAN
jgi:hypothetical protein